MQNSLSTPKHIKLQDKIISCYRLMQDLVLDNSRRKSTKVLLPQLRVTIRARMRSIGSDSSSSSSTSSYKRRKLNNCFWVHDDKGNSEWRERAIKTRDWKWGGIKQSGPTYLVSLNIFFEDLERKLTRVIRLLEKII